MADLLDSGARRDFGTGAVRDVAEGKGRCDLLPLRQVANLINCINSPDAVLQQIDFYVRNHEHIECLYNAINAFRDYHTGADICTTMLEVAKQYEDGARKYNDRNWEKGIPVHVFIDSGVRHYLKFLRGDKDEPHDRAFIWNMLGAIWTHENRPDLIDLPFANSHTPTDIKTSTEELTEEVKEEMLKPVGENPYVPEDWKQRVDKLKGKYEGLSNSILKECVCTHFIDCGDGCPLYVKYQTYKCENIWIANHPEEFRKIAIEYLEGLEGK